ncbi:MAG: DUF427 domain-containing protein [Chloroflexi bacterium]|nr:DUF427 domain-containing protein [Chloroflexota bacterium]
MPDLQQTLIEDRVISRGQGAAAQTGFRFEPCPRWVRNVFNGMTIASSKKVMLLHEPKRMPVYYFPREDVRFDLMQPAGSRRDDAKGTSQRWSISSGGQTLEDAAWTHDEPPEGCPDLRGYVAFYWNKMEAWYEEDDQVYVHPRDPYHRVDVLHSSRNVRVVALGETVAETDRPRLLFETGMPVRYYIPRQDVRMDLLRPSGTTSQCPYKGIASYWSVQVGDQFGQDLVWSYRFPIPECPKIENLMCFFNERVDAIYVDGELLPRVETAWSR